MRTHSHPLPLFALVAVVPVLVSVFWATGVPAAAQPGGPGDAGTVTGTGKSVLTRPATVLRVQIDVPAQGKTVEEAIAQLKAKRESLVAKLKSLGVAEGAVKFGDVRLSGTGPTGNAQQRYMQQMMRMARGGRGAAKKPEGPAVVAVLLPVTAEWTIQGTGAEEALVAGHKLREKIQKAGLSGKPDGEAGGAGVAAANAEAGEDEQEVAEEMAGMTDDEGGVAAAKPGEPRFTFVAKVTDADRAAASKEAFDKARAEATQVAQAAGGKVGRLRAVSAKLGPAAAEDDDPTMAMYAQAMQSMGMATQSATDTAEASGAEPGVVSLKVTVSASFALE